MSAVGVLASLNSTQTALLRVLSDIYAATDRPHVTLLDLSATFDCVDHEILQRLLGQSFGIRGTAPTWIKVVPVYSRTQQVCCACRLSFVMQLVYGV